MTTTSYNVPQQLTSVRLASTSNISGFYFNGTLNNGVGAILSSLSIGILSIDGVQVNQGDRILLSNQTQSNENGIYVVNNPGSNISLWKLQRTNDFQSLEQIITGQYFTVDAGNVLAGNLFVLAEPLPSAIGNGPVGFNFINVGNSGSSGPYLTIAGNLSDVQSQQQSFINLGFGSGQSLIVSTSDFDDSGGVYQLPNPCPNYVYISTINTGDVLRLPPAQGDGSFILSQGPNIISINSPGLQPIDIQLSDGTLFESEFFGGKNIYLTDKSTPEGSWESFPFVSQINSLGIEPDTINLNTGVFDLDSNIIPSNTNYTPVNYTPVETPNYQDVSVTGNLQGIDNALGSLQNQSLQEAYDTGANATIDLSSSRPITIESTSDNVQFPDSKSNSKTIFEIQSTTRSSIPIPPMTAAQRDAIGVTNFGSWVYVNDVSPRRPYVYDGTEWQGVAYISQLPPTLTQGQLIIGVDASSPVSGYLVSSDSSVNIDLSVNGQIDLTTNTSSGDTLQDAYNAGNTIDIVSGRPFLLRTSIPGAVTDGVTTPSTGINSTSNYQIWGFTFVPNDEILVTSFQVEDSTLPVGQTRTLAIYEKSTGTELAIGTVSKNDSLVGIYRTNALSSPVVLSGAIQYVLTAIVPPAQIYRSLSNAVPGLDITITEFSSGNSDPFPIPMSFPTSFTATANVTPYGAFQYELESLVSEFFVQNESSSFFMQSKSTTQATIPAPVMTNAQFSAIAAPEQGMLAFISDATVYPRLSTFDGSNYHQFAYTDDIQGGSYVPGITNVSGTTSISLIKAIASAPFVTIGNTAMVSLEFSYTATATTQVVTIDIPYTVLNNFSNVNQATLMGGSVYVNGSPAIGDGALLDITAVVGFSYVQLGIITANTTGTKVVSVSFMYQIQ